MRNLSIFFQPIEESEKDNHLISDPIILQGLVSPEDLGISNFKSRSQANHKSDPSTTNQLV